MDIIAEKLDVILEREEQLESLCHKLAEACEKASERLERESRAEGGFARDKDNLYLLELSKDCKKLKDVLSDARKAGIIT